MFFAFRFAASVRAFVTRVRQKVRISVFHALRVLNRAAGWGRSVARTAVSSWVHSVSKSALVRVASSWMTISLIAQTTASSTLAVRIWSSLERYRGGGSTGGPAAANAAWAHCTTGAGC